MNRLLLFLSAIFLCMEISCNKSSSPNNPQNQGPQITAIHPTHGPGGSADTIIGSGFIPNTSLDSLFINGVKAAVTASSDTQLIITVPSLCGSGKVSLNSNGTTISGPIFTYDTTYGWTSIAQGFVNPRNLAVDTAGNIYVANTNGGSVSVVRPDGTVSIFLSIFKEPWGLAIDRNDNIYISDVETVYGTTIYKYNAQGVGGSMAIIDGDFTSLACDSAGNLYAAYSDGTSTTNVDKISPSGAITRLVTEGGNAMNFGICPNPAGGFYLSGGDNGLQSYFTTLTNSGVLAYTTLTGNPGNITPSDILFYGNNLYVTSQPTNSIYKISPEGNANPIITNIPLPWGLAVDKSGDMIVCSAISGPTTGQVSRITYK